MIARRDAAVVLLDAGDDFVVELVFQRRKRREDGIGVGVFRVEIGEHLCVFAGVVAQPVVFILPLAMRRGDSVRAFFGVGRGLRVQGVHRQYQGEKERFEVHGGLAVEMSGYDSRREYATARAGLLRADSAGVMLPGGKGAAFMLDPARVPFRKAKGGVRRFVGGRARSPAIF